jgi:hypothetical protein
MYVCVDWHVKVFFLRTYTHINRTNQQPKKMLSKQARECAIKKYDSNCVILAFFFSFSLSLIVDEQTLSKYFEYSCKRSSRFFNHNHRHSTIES